MKEIAFEHKMAAHCESGTVTALLNNKGFDITEPMVFGISGNIFFGYFESSNFPFPTFIVRNKPGSIRRNLEKHTGIKFYIKSFRKEAEGKIFLDKLIEKDIPTAVQVDFFYMDYLPEWQRVHINVHFVNVIGINENNYIVSDSYFPRKAKISMAKLTKARFVKGFMAPKGFLFYPEHIPESIPLEKAVLLGIKQSAHNMVKLPLPFLGVKGMRKFAKKVVEWPKMARNIDHLSHEIMKIALLLEEQGTGGAGYRYIFASFLQQAADVLHEDSLKTMSKRMMEIGDHWRDISYFAAKIGKNRDLGPDKLKQLGDMFIDRAEEEQVFFTDLYKLVK